MGNNPEQNRRYYAMNRERLNARRRDRYRENPEQERAQSKRWAKENPDRRSFVNARGALMRRYGLDQNQAEVALISQQGDLCAYCGEFARLCVDHNHTTGAARGMVCAACNMIAGALEHPKLAKVQAALATQ